MRQNKQGEDAADFKWEVVLLLVSHTATCGPEWFPTHLVQNPFPTAADDADRNVAELNGSNNTGSR